MLSMDAPITTTPNGLMTMLQATIQARMQLVRFLAVAKMAEGALVSTKIAIVFREIMMAFPTHGLKQPQCAKAWASACASPKMN